MYGPVGSWYHFAMLEIDLHRSHPDPRGAGTPPQDSLLAENAGLRLLLVQAEISAQGLLAQAGIEARERETADKLQKLILEELHHRIKNTLATVSAIATQSMRNAPSTMAAQHAIEGRLKALGRAHDLLLQARWSSADLGTIVRSATEAFDSGEVGAVLDRRTGYPASPRATVIAFAMTLNELCTNTTKFGALSIPARPRRHCSWLVDAPTQRLQFTWTEKRPGDPAAHYVDSFGTRLIETLGKQLRGVVLLTYEPSGFVYRLEVPLASLTLAAAR